MTDSVTQIEDKAAPAVQEAEGIFATVKSDAEKAYAYLMAHAVILAAACTVAGWALGKLNLPF